jgi:hypothetical protein
MNKSHEAESETALAAAINLEFVRNVAQAGDEAGIEEVAAFHHSLFMHRHGLDLERFRQQRRVSEDRIADLEARLADTRERLTGENPHVAVLEAGQPDTTPNAPWNLWDGAMFWIAAAAVLSLLVFGVFNVSFNLLESGIVTFTEHPVRAYLWAALLPVGALAVKVGWDFLESRRRRDAYLWTCLGVGLAALVVWVAAYASVYPALSMTTEERIANLSIEAPGSAGRDTLSQLTSGGVKRIDMIIVGAQAFAEICLSAALGIYLTRLYSKHRPVRLAANPTFAKLDQERCSLEERLSRERLAFADAAGGMNRLEHQRDAFVAYAKSLFQKEAGLRRDRGHQKRRLLDQIADQLKSRLAEADGEADPGETPSNNGDHNRLALDSR